MQRVIEMWLVDAARVGIVGQERWIAEGERFLEREDDLRLRKKPATPARSGTTSEAGGSFR